MILQIEGEDIELGSQIVAITKQAFDVSDLSQRKLGRTNGFDLPLTIEALKKFKRPSYINSGNKSFEKFYNCKLKDNNLQLMKGVGILQEVSNRIKFQMVDQSKQFFDGLNSGLKELDFETDDFTFGTAAYNSLKTPSTSVWLWAGASMHENKIGSKTFLTDLKFSRPFLNVRKLFDKIFSTQNWNYTAIDNEVSFIDLINQMIISVNHVAFYVTDFQKTLSNTITLSGTPVLLTDLTVNDFEESAITTYTNKINIVTHQAAFRLRGNLTVNGSDIKITFKGTSSPLASDVQSQEFLLRDGQTYIDIKTNVFKTTEAGNEIEIEFSGNGSVIFDDCLLYTIIEEQTLGDLSTNAIDGFYVKYHDNAPDFTQLEFLRNLWTMVGMIWNDDSFSKNIDIFTFQQLNKLNSIDWSKKFNTDLGTWTISNNIGNFGKKSYLKYDNDSATPSNEGEATIEIDNDTLPNEIDLITLGFSASPEVEISNLNMADLPCYDDEKRINTLNPRICTYYTNTTYTVAEFKDTLDWQVLKEGNNKKLFDSFNNLRYLEGQFDLNRNDVVSFNHKKVVYIDYFQSYFIVLRIEDFIPGYLTECKLLRLN